MTKRHRILLVALLASPLNGLAAASPARDHQPPPDTAVPKALLDLRARLLSTERAQAQGDAGRFRALCDDDGYPLVGNIANKAGRYQPSELCADVRKAAKR
jgi:hypothetical protein